MLKLYAFVKFPDFLSCSKVICMPTGELRYCKAFSRQIPGVYSCIAIPGSKNCSLKRVLPQRVMTLYLPTIAVISNLLFN